ncbi:MAG TPA: energy transducer TonB [Phycisphaerales bacterium]|nr:energy transducer TonB [Phycisphaerales bacterium]
MSLVAHVGLLFAALAIFSVAAPETVARLTEPIRVVYLKQVGPGGGGGGNPAPAPPKPVSIPKPQPRETPPPVTPPPVIPPPPPPPRLTAPVTTNTDLVQATGARSVSLATFGGEGRGTGIGAGRGAGVGEGETAGFGGGAYRIGAGITEPRLLREVKPTYTTDALRAKLQGLVTVEAVVLADGTVGDVRVVKSLDRVTGLDNEAIKAARRWLFSPATDREGKPVPVIVMIELGFRLY